ncbi:unnamed protein product [Bursaphelenchus okinawaensis]|uniref:Uncharacterized protein n=1 Tax=Bursaphelenchus okinawaensis TaxID=465554 RepID=A0A811JV36_9BILA|nr:unnamed protein product [Bursaphelenchus okinawaensis]CAG9084440.1 unnamed protein product [Bursaphelenchus okinawaensis]
MFTGSPAAKRARLDYAKSNELSDNCKDYFCKYFVLPNSSHIRLPNLVKFRNVSKSTIACIRRTNSRSDADDKRLQFPQSHKSKTVESLNFHLFSDVNVHSWQKIFRNLKKCSNATANITTQRGTPNVFVRYCLEQLAPMLNGALLNSSRVLHNLRTTRPFHLAVMMRPYQNYLAPLFNTTAYAIICSNLRIESFCGQQDLPVSVNCKQFQCTVNLKEGYNQRVYDDAIEKVKHSMPNLKDFLIESLISRTELEKYNENCKQVVEHFLNASVPTILKIIIHEPMDHYTLKAVLRRTFKNEPGFVSYCFYALNNQ